MLRTLTVFHRGGAVLWSTNSTNNTEDTSVSKKDESMVATNALIETVLATERTSGHTVTDASLASNDRSQNSMQWEGLTLKWTFANQLDLVFVAAYFSFQKLFYIDDLLETVKRYFLREFEDFLINATLSEMMNLSAMKSYARFDKTYIKITRAFVSQFKSVSSAPKQFKDTSKGRAKITYDSGSKKTTVKKKKKDEAGDGSVGSRKTASSTTTAASTSASKSSSGGGTKIGGILLGQKLKSVRGPRAFQPKAGRGKKRGSDASTSSSDPKKNNSSAKNNNKNGKKEGRDWGVWSKKPKALTNEQMSEFSMCDEDHNTDEWEIDETLGAVNLDDSDDDSDIGGFEIFRADGSVFGGSKKSSGDEGLSSESDPSSSSSAISGLWSRFSRLISPSALTAEDLKGPLEELTLLLSGKNVTHEVSREICESVSKSLIGKKISSLTSVRSVMKDALTDALKRILTPSRGEINILHGIQKARNEGRTYSVVFIGVNGVGKSTSLSKMIFYLKNRGLKVSVAACDTFRSGAVEQLKTHCMAHKVRLYQQGYAKDPASVAYNGIREANRVNDDVILVDTAGRMQNNQGLMRALTTLISRNQPDLILFVGEALVGNDGVDQLIEFDRALHQFSTDKHPRSIDGIVLTKFDAVDDKVGAAISMVYQSGKPILFVGVGQTYSDLRRMNVQTFVSKLLS